MVKVPVAVESDVDVGVEVALGVVVGDVVGIVVAVDEGIGLKIASCNAAVSIV